MPTTKAAADLTDVGSCSYLCHVLKVLFYRM